MSEQQTTITPSQPDPTRLASEAKPISPEAYNAVIADLVPLSVILLESTFTVSGAASQQMSTIAQASPAEIAGKQCDFDGHCVTQVNQSFQFALVGGESTAVATGRAVFAVKIRTAIDPPREFWDIFLQRNVKLYTHPPLRDLVSSFAARAGFICAPLSSVSVTLNIVKL